MRLSIKVNRCNRAEFKDLFQGADWKIEKDVPVIEAPGIKSVHINRKNHESNS